MADIVTLDVGDVVYRTTLATLTRYPDSMLGAMFSGRHRVTTDDQGRCFIDRDGSMFAYVLNFLRDSKLVLPEDFNKFDMLRKEAVFYQLQPLVDAIKKARQERRPERRKIESLELGKEPTGLKIRGEKRTVDTIVGRLPTGGIDLQKKLVSSRSRLTATTSDVIEISINHYYPEQRQATIQAVRGRGPFGQQGIEVLSDSEIVASLHNIIFDLGFTLKSSIPTSTPTGKLEVWLFERS